MLITKKLLRSDNFNKIVSEEESPLVPDASNGEEQNGEDGIISDDNDSNGEGEGAGEGEKSEENY